MGSDLLAAAASGTLWFVCGSVVERCSIPPKSRHPLGPTSNRQNAIVSQFFLFLGYLLLKGSPCGTTRARHFSSELDPSKEAIRSVTHLGLACGMEQEASAKFEPKGTAEH